MFIIKLYVFAFYNPIDRSRAIFFDKLKYVIFMYILHSFKCLEMIFIRKFSRKKSWT